MKYFVVDAFTDELFKGNQAGVCLVDEWPSEDTMQKIAFENNLSETAFVLKQGEHYGLRWFTPAIEVDLCGHATLASAFVIFNFMDTTVVTVKFETISGTLIVNKMDDLYELDFPSRKPVQVELTREMNQAIRIPALEAHLSRDLLLVLENEQQVKNLRPNFDMIRQLDYFAVVATAKGSEVDFVSRFFTPRGGVLEDPVTGSAHCSLIPFWAERLGKTKMVARQLSTRGGTLYCQDAGDRVKIAGKTVLYLQGEIFV
ncbi:MAG: PhzF family phenazine biosynthesis protein [Firmicutes bacterium]|nr:PhzF family phenazine biosynthesis protein [Bacillota bacterium]